MTENQRKALQAAEDAFRRYADHHAMRGDEAKARANMALAGQMSAALAEKHPPLTDQQIARFASGLDGCTGLPVHSSPENWRKVFSFARASESAAQAQGEDWQLTEAEVGNLWHQHLTKLPHEASAAEFIAGVRAGASAVRQKAGLA